MLLQAPWHKESYDDFLNRGLPRLLAGNLPLAGYLSRSTGEHTCTITITAGSQPAEVTFENLPQPGLDGLFEIDGQTYVVIPVASEENLEQAVIACVGQQMLDWIAERLGKAPDGDAALPWDAALLRAWLPLDQWINRFLSERAQLLDDTNWYSRHTHLRRLLIPDRRQVVAAGQMGRVDPFETPEGPNIGRVFTIASGAAIQGQRLVILDPSPEGGLGHNSLMIPFLEHDHPNHLLMAVNMMRQALPAPEPEPALVQSGNEPSQASGDFWCGRNLLTAFVSLGEATAERGIVLSESAARRLNYPYQAEPGDKLSNRHGTKGVVSQVLPDHQMPHLPDGQPVELVYSFHAIHTHLNFGQILEAVMSQVARQEQRSLTVPPFHAPKSQEIQAALRAAGLAEAGQVRLRDGQDGPEMDLPSTVGWVYWFRLAHLAQGKLRVFTGEGEGQRMGDMEVAQLLAAGATRSAAEALTTRSVRRAGATDLARQMAQGSIEAASPPSPALATLAQRLALAGIDMRLEGQSLTFAQIMPPGGLELAQPMPHPWLPDTTITRLAHPQAFAHDEEYAQIEYSYTQIEDANRRLNDLIRRAAPLLLRQSAAALLAERLQAYYNELVPAHLLLNGERQFFSGRAVIAPGLNLSYDQVGLPEAMAWQLFGPLAARTSGEQAVAQRTPQAAQALDQAMASAWVIVNRAPTLGPAQLQAMRPRRTFGPVIRLNPLYCYPLNGDFDGDQAAVFLPLTLPAQQEAGEKLSLAAHLRRDPALLPHLLPPDALFGLAWLSLQASPNNEITALLGLDHPLPAGRPLSRAGLARLLDGLLEARGPHAALEAVQSLARLGWQAARRSGASLSPFIAAAFQLPPQPADSNEGAWQSYQETVAEIAAGGAEFRDPQDGPQRLLGQIADDRPRLHLLVGPSGPLLPNTLVFFDGEAIPLPDSVEILDPPVIITHSLAQGLTPQEMFALVTQARQGLARLGLQGERILAHTSAGSVLTGNGVLARARRVRSPGIVFARAAAFNETDPLEDTDSRIFVGLSG